jgi:predicted dehydrogenase
LISIEGRYWHSSATRESTGASWKDAPELGGGVGALLDLATHWADLVTYICGGLPGKAAVRRWFVNAPSPNRDTHVHLTMEFGELLSFGSISKTVHGAGNILEISVLGERASASWSFQNPDVVVWGDKGAQTTQVRSAPDLPSRPAPFHGLGWMEGYGRLVGEVVAQIRGNSVAEATTLREHLDLLSCLLQAAEAESTN